MRAKLIIWDLWSQFLCELITGTKPTFEYWRSTSRLSATVSCDTSGQEWYQALRSIRISQSVGTRDDEQYIVFVGFHYKHVNTNLFPSGARPSARTSATVVRVSVTTIRGTLGFYSHEREYLGDKANELNSEDDLPSSGICIVLSGKCLIISRFGSTKTI